MNATTETLRRKWNGNGPGRRLSAIAALVAIIGGIATAVVWVARENAWTSDMIRVAAAEQQERERLVMADQREHAEIRRENYQRQIAMEMRLNEIRRQQIDAQLTAMAARKKAGFVFDSDEVLKQPLIDERRELIGHYIELRTLQQDRTGGIPHNER